MVQFRSRCFAAISIAAGLVSACERKLEPNPSIIAVTETADARGGVEQGVLRPAVPPVPLPNPIQAAPVATPMATYGQRCSSPFPAKTVITKKGDRQVSAGFERWDARQARFKTSLPSFLTREQILTWVEHPSGEEKVEVFARRMPTQGTIEHWVIVAANHTARVAVLAVEPSLSGAKISCLAKTASAVAADPEWAVLPNNSQGADRGDSASGRGGKEMAEYGRFLAIDPAVYQWDAQEALFGLRFEWKFPNGYGRTAHFESLLLLHRSADTLVPVWDEPIEVGVWFSGRAASTEYWDDWVEGSYTVHVAKEMTDGVFDLLLRNRNANATRRWKWNGTRKVYDCAD